MSVNLHALHESAARIVVRAWARVVTLPRRASRCWRRACDRLQSLLLLRLSFASIERYALLLWCFKSLFNAQVRCNGIVRYETGRDLYGLDPRARFSAMSAGMREALIDQRMHIGQQAMHGELEPLPDLRAIGERIARCVREIRREQPGRLVIFAPFHYVSQYANIHMILELRAALGIERIAVVSGVVRDRYGDDAAVTPGMEILYTYGEDNRNGLGLRLVRALKRDGIATLFADVPPFTLQKYPMETVDVTICNRAARIHNGVFRVGGRLDAVLLPCYLTLEQGRFDVRLFEPVPLADADAPQRVAHCIERALAENFAHGLYGDFPALYGFAPEK